MIGKFKPKSEFLQNVLTLITGTTLAQAVSILASPILSRLFTPEDYGLLGTYLSVVTILSLLATARYDYVILLPKSERSAANVLGLSSVILVIYVLLVFMGIIVGLSLGFFDSDILGKWIYIVPFSLFMLSLNQVFNYWHNRKQRYKLIALKRIAQTLSVAICAITLGLTEISSGGLLIANIVGSSIGLAVFSVTLFIKDAHEVSQVTLQEMKKIGFVYIKYPKYVLPANLLSGSSHELPVLFLSAYAGAFYTGQYAFMRRIITLPMRLIGGATASVFRQKAAQLFNDTGNCFHLYTATLKKLLFVAIPSFSFLFFAGPALFTIIFGDAWSEAGQYVRILVPMFFFQMLDSPLSSVALVAGREKYSFLWQLSKLLLTLLSFIVGLLVLQSVNLAITLFSVSLSILYLIDLFFTYHFAKGDVTSA